jgi:hypothetical protein
MSLTSPEILKREGEASMHQTLSGVLSRTLKPLCPRDSRVTHYERRVWRYGIHASYHCGYTGCSVRYTPQQGYFTVVKTPEQPYFVEEPATNVLQCPRHGAWLYRCQDEKEARIVWRCGVEECQHTHADIPGPWLHECKSWKRFPSGAGYVQQCGGSTTCKSPMFIRSRRNFA